MMAETRLKPPNFRPEIQLTYLLAHHAWEGSRTKDGPLRTTTTTNFVSFLFFVRSSRG